MTNCKRCGEFIDNFNFHNAFCGRCNKEETDMQRVKITGVTMECAKCGNKIPLPNNFCDLKECKNCKDKFWRVSG